MRPSRGRRAGGGGGDYLVKQSISSLSESDTRGKGASAEGRGRGWEVSVPLLLVFALPLPPPSGSLFLSLSHFLFLSLFPPSFLSLSFSTLISIPHNLFSLSLSSHSLHDALPVPLSSVILLPPYPSSDVLSPSLPPSPPHPPSARSVARAGLASDRDLATGYRPTKAVTRLRSVVRGGERWRGAESVGWWRWRWRGGG